MGLFKAMRDIRKLTEQATELRDQQQAAAGYKPGMRGSFAQMGDMLHQATEQLGEIGEMQSGTSELLRTGVDGEGVIIGMGTPARGASWFNLDIDLEVHIPGRDAYRVANQYLVPASAQIGPGVRLPLKVDPADLSKIAIDWSRAPQGPARGEIRPAT